MNSTKSKSSQNRPSKKVKSRKVTNNIVNDSVLLKTESNCKVQNEQNNNDNTFIK